MKSKILSLLICVTALFSSSVFARASAMNTYDNIAVSGNDGKALQAEQVKKAIQTVAAKREWTTKANGEGKLIANLDVRGKHNVTIAISYSGSQFSLTYQDSINMNFKKRDGGADIHPSYNKWLDTLKREIVLEAQKP